MTTTANMSLVLPTPGGDSGTWDDLLNAALTLVDAHDHTTGKGPRVPTTGININADLTMASNALTNIGSLGFAEITALASGSRRLFFSSADHELYVRTNGGTNVKITNGAALNISIVGGIVGDYASVGAEVAYNDANDRYTFKQETGAGAVKQWATMASGHVDIYEQLATASATTISNRVRLSSPAALAASYAMTFPAALPGSTQILQVSSTGAITASNTVANAVTLSAGLTIGADQNITISGTGELKHGSRVLAMSPFAAVIVSGWAINGGGYVLSSAAGTFYVPLPLRQGDRITSLTFARYGDAAADVTAEVQTLSSAGSITGIGGGTVTNPAASWADSTFDLTDTTLAAGDAAFFIATGNAANLRIGTIRVTYERP
ncbi:MAG: hypothetical protein KBD62_32280 [Kofleriaceae bacterium]|nr:hypothetical protein [Kofleriaceae bacterium]